MSEFGPARRFRIGTRGSDLARKQAKIVGDAIQRANPGAIYELVIIRTEGDERAGVEFSHFEGQGVFVRRIEAALLAGEVDVAVHSFKDMPSAPTPGLRIAAFPTREDPRDALVSRDAVSLARLGAGSVVGTGSPRRQALLREARADLEVQGIRGNVDTRLRRVHDGEIDAVVVALAGLRRLGREGEATEPLDPLAFTPAVGQGILAVQVRAEDEPTARIVEAIDDPETRACALAERAVAAAVSAGCQTPLGAFGRIADGVLQLSACLAGGRDGQLIRAEEEGPPEEAESVGVRVGAALLQKMSGRRAKDRPLVGRTVLVTRPAGQAARLVEALRAEGATTAELPVIAIEPPSSYEAMDEAIRRRDYDWVVFTSANGVRFFYDRLVALGESESWFATSRVAAIGPETAHSLTTVGVMPDLVPDEFVAEALVACLADAAPLHGRRVLLPRADIARDALAAGLAAAGASVHSVVAYRTVAASASLEIEQQLEAGAIDAVSFTSSSTVRAFLAMLPSRQLLSGVTLACIGPITARTLEEAGLQPTVVAETYTVSGLVRALSDYYRDMDPGQVPAAVRTAR